MSPRARSTTGLSRAADFMGKLTGLHCIGDHRPTHSPFRFNSNWDGLEWRGAVGRDGQLLSRGKKPFEQVRRWEIPAGTKDRYSDLVKLAAPKVIEVNNHWQIAVAQALEGLTKESLHQLFGPLKYDVRMLPPGFNASEEDGFVKLNHIMIPRNQSWIPHWTRYVGYSWKCGLEEAIKELWFLYENTLDPPGYTWKVDGEQHKTPLWSWKWGGANITTSDCPKDRPTARQDAWQDFWLERRAVALES